ncbi:MAG: alpha/beta fold hydrolase [Leptolyngbyaceae cyanobacterium MO_188.B28]|nr:alpha/beta fold hydrolase [Leptolyngbyaceae cyanobacterium MO_188.B28]
MTTAIAPTTGAYWQWRNQSIYYTRAGSSHLQRPPLLLIHGFGASTDHWRKNIDELQQDFEVWAVDLVGFGRSAKPKWQYSGDLWRDQLHDFITEVIGRPAVLVGNSLGGYASICVAAQRSESAWGVALLNSAGPFSDTKPASKPNPIQAAIGKISRTLLLQPVPSWLLFQYVRRRATIRKTLEKVYVNKDAITDQLVEEIYRPSCDAGAAQVFASVFKSPQGEKIDVLLGQMACPLLTLWGEGDPWIDAHERGAKFRHHYPQLKEHYLKAGHCPHDEEPEQVNGLLRDWVLGSTS